MPAYAGIQDFQLYALWIPAFAGMTYIESKSSRILDFNVNSSYKVQQLGLDHKTL